MKKKLFQGTLVVMAFSFIVKALSILYKIPYQNITGDFGFYVYQQAYPLFAIVVLFTSYALPLAISELMIESNFQVNLKKLTGKMTIIFIGLALLILILIKYFIILLNDPKLVYVILVFALILIITPMNGILKGALLSNVQTIGKAGVAPFIEQVIRVGVILVILYLYNRGYIVDLYQVATLSFVGLLIGMLISLLYMLKYIGPFNKTGEVDVKQDLKKLFIRSLSLLFSASVLLLFQLMDSFTITAILSRKMTIIDAMKTKGIYDRGLPLIQASLFFVTPIISVYLPHTNKETNKLGYGKLLEIIFSLALPATIGLIFVLRQVNRLLFNSNALSNVIQLSVTAIVLYAVMLTLTAIKQKGSKPTLIFMVAILLKLIFNLIFIDLFGIIGASVATVIALLFMVICLFIIYKKYMTLSTMNISKIIVSSSTMALFLYYSQFHWFLNLLFVRILLGLLVYIFVAFIINLFQIRTIISQRRQRFEKEA